MSDKRAGAHPILPVPEDGPAIPFYWNGEKLLARPGEAVSSALFAAGVHTFGHHPRDGKPLGIFCANGQCAQCTVIANGVAVKSCMTPVAENMVVAAESLGMGSCFLGGVPYGAGGIIKRFKLPERVFPLVGLTMGYPDEAPPPRPRYPLDFALFEDEYPRFSEEQVERAATEMDEGYLAQDYYRPLQAMIHLEDGREETFTYDTYSWTEHISRKAGQWERSPDQLLKQFAACGFHIPGYEVEESD